MQLYVYTAENCPKCGELKRQLKERGNNMYIERSADRLKNPVDAIDREALVEASINNMKFPVVVDWHERCKYDVKNKFDNLER